MTPVEPHLVRLSVSSTPVGGPVRHEGRLRERARDNDL